MDLKKIESFFALSPIRASALYLAALPLSNLLRALLLTYRYLRHIKGLDRARIAAPKRRRCAPSAELAVTCGQSRREICYSAGSAVLAAKTSRLWKAPFD